MVAAVAATVGSAPAALGRAPGSAPATSPATTPATSPARAGDSSRTPMRVTLQTLTPSTIPRTGKVRVTGRIVNRSQQTWTDLKVYLLTSGTPIRSRAELSRAAATDADAQVGERLADQGLYVQVGDLAPGQSVPYRLALGRANLGISGEPGVYWVGVHVLGTSPEGRDNVADGRARTFMPLLPRTRSAAGARDRTRLALVVPVERRVLRGAAGRLREAGAWERALARDGRLDRLLRLSRRSSHGGDITWAVDPALLDAVRSLAAGNPVVDAASGPVDEPSGSATGPASGASGSASATPSGSAAAGPSSSATPDSEDGDSGGGSEESSVAASARRWLAMFRRQASAHVVLALPYADLDVAAALTASGDDLYRRAVQLSTATLAAYGVEGPTPAVDPPSGYLPGAALDRVDAGSVVVLDHRAFPDADRPVLTSPGRAPVVLTDTAAGSGGPAPTSQYAALAVRQRLLADSALHAMSSRRGQPLVVTMPPTWDPGDAWRVSRFFSGLSTPWLQLVGVGSAVATASSPAPGASKPTPVYPDRERAAELPRDNLHATRTLIRSGGVFAGLLTDDHGVDDVLARVAMLASSTQVRDLAADARAQARRSNRYVRDQMARVRIEGPQFVMMSGESGPIQVTLVNDLEDRVRVGVAVRTPGSDLRIDPVQPVTLAPGRRTTVQLHGRSHDIGVHSVVLSTTDASGHPLGSRVQFSVRTSHVSTVIWVIMGVAAALLLVAIVIRLVRRVRRRRATHGPLLRRAAPGREPAP